MAIITLADGVAVEVESDGYQLSGNISNYLGRPLTQVAETVQKIVGSVVAGMQTVANAATLQSCEIEYECVGMNLLSAPFGHALMRQQ